MTQAVSRELEVLRAALKEAVEVIESLAGQQAMPDTFYVAPLRRFKDVLRGWWL